jgi:hypothetical protein
MPTVARGDEEFKSGDSALYSLVKERSGELASYAQSPRVSSHGFSTTA